MAPFLPFYTLRLVFHSFILIFKFQFCMLFVTKFGFILIYWSYHFFPFKKDLIHVSLCCHWCSVLLQACDWLIQIFKNWCFILIGRFLSFSLFEIFMIFMISLYQHFTLFISGCFICQLFFSKPFFTACCHFLKL